MPTAREEYYAAIAAQDEAYYARRKQLRDEQNRQFDKLDAMLTALELRIQKIREVL
jgi:hypothetical protein